MICNLQKRRFNVVVLALENNLLLNLFIFDIARSEIIIRSNLEGHHVVN